MRLALVLLAACGTPNPRVIDSGALDSPGCLDGHEPNDSRETAAELEGTGTLTDVALCTPGDVDHYRLVTTQTGNLGARVEGVAAQVELLSGTGTLLASGQPGTCLPNAPAGIYFVRVSGQTPGSYGLVLACN